jgi:hypothetical protein
MMLFNGSCQFVFCDSDGKLLKTKEQFWQGRNKIAIFSEFLRNTVSKTIWNRLEM